MVTMGEEISAGEDYQRLQAMFFRTGTESLATLQMRLANCRYQQGEEIFSWLARLDNIFSQFRAAGSPLDDAEMKHRAMSLISTVPIWGFMAHLLGAGGGVSYREWKQQMMRKEEEIKQNGQIAGKQLADELYGHKATDVASPATALHQTFRGSGFSDRGRAIHRGGAQTRGVFSRGRAWFNRGNLVNRGGAQFRGVNGRDAIFFRGSQSTRGGARYDFNS